MSEPQRVSHYAQFLDVIRARIAELALPYDTVDDVCGFPTRYMAKVLCDPPIKRLGAYAIFTLLDGLGLDGAVFANPEKLILLQKQSKWVKRKYRPHMRGSTTHTNSFCFMPDFVRIRGRKGGLARAIKLTAKQRSASARKAANARWQQQQTVVR